MQRTQTLSGYSAFKEFDATPLFRATAIGQFWPGLSRIGDFGVAGAN
jgi:hypothetical protein